MWLVAVIILGLVFAAGGTARRHRKGQPIDILDTPLLFWTKKDAFTIRHLLANLIVFGRTGAGKSSTIGRILSSGILSNPMISLLILAAKPEDKPEWIKLHKKAGRELIVVEPDGPWHFNVLAYEIEHGADTRTLVDIIRTLGESTIKGGVRSSAEAAFFETEENRSLYHAITLVKLATGTITAPDLEEFLSGAAEDLRIMDSEEWRKDFHNQCILAAYKKPKTAMEARAEYRARKYFLGEWPTMADKTRSNIKSGNLGILHVFNCGYVHQILSTDTTCSPDNMLKQGVSILVNTPPSAHGVEGKFINAAFKYVTQRAVLRRCVQPGDVFNVIYSDEFQLSVNSHDETYLAQCRSHWGGMVCLTQSIHSIYSQMKEATGKSQTASLLSNFGMRAFMALGDSESAEFASSLLGRCLQTYLGGSTQPAADPFGELMGHSTFTGSFSTHVEKVVEPKAFMSGLRTGGARNKFFCDAILVQSGDPFSNGESWIKVALSQR